MVSVAGVLAMSAILVLYCFSTPRLFGDLVSTFLMYAQIAPYRAQGDDLNLLSQVNQSVYADVTFVPVYKYAGFLGAELVHELGLSVVALASLSLAVFTWGADRFRIVAAGLLAPAAVCFVLMREHTYDHQFQILLLAAPASIALAVALDWLGKSGTSASSPQALAAVVVIPTLMLLPLIRAAISTSAREDREIEYARQIEAETPPGSIVMAPSASMVPVYYSRRHIIRCVAGDSIVIETLPKLSKLFPGVAVFLAVDPKDASAFPLSLRRYRTAAVRDKLILLSIQNPI